MNQAGLSIESSQPFRFPRAACMVMLCAMSLILSACTSINANPLKGLETAQAGSFSRLDRGVLYLPQNWTRTEAWPVTVVLHGYGELSLGLSSKYFWKDWAERYGIVLFFPETGHMGWHENPDSDDTKQLLAAFRRLRKTSWVKKDGIQLFGWSAGAIMALDLVALNRKNGNHAGIFDRVAISSGGFGTPMDERLRRDPKLAGVIRTPIFFAWGDAEAPDHGKDAADVLAALGWSVESKTHPGGHYLDPVLTGEALSRNKK